MSVMSLDLPVLSGCSYIAQPIGCSLIVFEASNHSGNLCYNGPYVE